MKEDREPKVGCGFCDRGFIHEGSGSFVRCHHCNPEQPQSPAPNKCEHIGWEYKHPRTVWCPDCKEVLIPNNPAPKCKHTAVEPSVEEIAEGIIQKVYSNCHYTDHLTYKDECHLKSLIAEALRNERNRKCTPRSK